MRLVIHSIILSVIMFCHQGTVLYLWRVCIIMTIKLVLQECDDSSPLSVKRFHAVLTKFLMVLDCTVVPEMVLPWMSKTV